MKGSRTKIRGAVLLAILLASSLGSGAQVKVTALQALEKYRLESAEKSCDFCVAVVTERVDDNTSQVELAFLSNAAAMIVEIQPINPSTGLLLGTSTVITIGAESNEPVQDKLFQFTAIIHAYKDVGALEIKMRPKQENASFNHKLTVPLSNKPEVSLMRVGK